MRKSIVILAVLTLAAVLSPLTASASSSSVTLSAPTTGTITFSGNGGNPLMTITGPTPTGPFSGLAVSGVGSFAGVTSFTLSGGPITFTPSSGNVHGYDAAIGSTLTLGLSNGFTGTLSDISLNQVGKTVTLSGNLGSGGQVTLIITMEFGTPLSNLKPPHERETGTLQAGGVTEGSSVTPEPSTMLLFGSGLLVFAAVLRRKVLV